jgi:hypothetical protein
LITDIVTISYSDPLTGGSPDIELSVVDRGVIPIAPKATIELEIGRVESPYRLRAGLFEVDRISLQNNLRTIAATGLPLSDPQLKLKRDADYSEYRLIDILEEIAERYRLSVFTIDLPDIEFSQLAQTNQSDLDFLNGLANRIGAVFKIENRELIFTLLIDLETRPPLFAINSTQFINYSETILGTETYQYIDYEVVLFGDREYIRVEDTRVFNGKIITYRGAGVGADDENLMVIAAREQLRRINGTNYLFDFEILGDWRMIAGSVFTLDGRSAFVDRVIHTINTQDKLDWVASLSCRYLPP